MKCGGTSDAQTATEEIQQIAEKVFNLIFW